MKRIAARVGFSEAAMYRHFATKQALLLGLMDRLEDQLLVPARAIAGQAETPALERLASVVRHHLSLVLERHRLPIEMLAEASAAGDPVLLSRMRGIMRGYMDVLVCLGEEAAAGGSLPRDIDPGVLAVWLLGGPAGMALEHRLRLDPSLQRRAEGELVPFIFGLLTRGGSKPAIL